MLFSIIIPVYNVEPYLRDCLDSVLHQTFADWEAVCVNDGSTDHSGEILEDYAANDSRFKVLAKPNGGLSSARNAGMVVAKGDYILFLDSDDWLEPNALETIVKEVNDEDMLCFSGRRYFEAPQSFNPADQLVEKAYNSGMEYYNENALQHRDFAFVCVVLRAYKRSFLVNNGLVFKEGIFHEDNLFTPKACFFAKQVKVVNACLYDYRVRAHSITDGNQAKRPLDMITVANELAAFFTEKQGIDNIIVFQAITHHYQRVFADIPKTKKKEVKQLCHWRLYRKVSRTKLRHRMNYLKNRLF